MFEIAISFNRCANDIYLFIYIFRTRENDQALSVR